jgi:hypothetical protein
MENSVASLALHRSESGSEKLVGGEGLSPTIAGCVLPLATALGYATGVAAALRERPGKMGAHTTARPERVEVGPLGAVLLPPEHSAQQTEQDTDVVAIGALLYELMVGSRPPQDLSQVVVPRVPRVGSDGVRVAATRLALHCLGAAGDPPAGMQRVLTEVRLYSVIARLSGQPATAMELAAWNPSLPLPPCGNPLFAVADGPPSCSRRRSRNGPWMPTHRRR